MSEGESQVETFFILSQELLQPAKKTYDTHIQMARLLRKINQNRSPLCTKPNIKVCMVVLLRGHLQTMLTAREKGGSLNVNATFKHSGSQDTS